MAPFSTPTTSYIFENLVDKKRRIENELERSNKMLTGLEASHLGSLKIKLLAAEDLNEVLAGYEMAAEYEQDRIGELKNELAETNKSISDEEEWDPVEDPKLNVMASFGVFADFEGAINITLIYGVSFFFLTCLLLIWEKNVAVRSVTWNAGYDIRVDTKKKDKSVTLTYKAGITQNTGEVRIASSYHAVPH